MNSIPINPNIATALIICIFLICIVAIGSRSLNPMHLFVGKRGFVFRVEKQRVDQVKSQDEKPVPPSLEL